MDPKLRRTCVTMENAHSVRPKPIVLRSVLVHATVRHRPCSCAGLCILAGSIEDRRRSDAAGVPDTHAIWSTRVAGASIEPRVRTRGRLYQQIKEPAERVTEFADAGLTAYAGSASLLAY